MFTGIIECLGEVKNLRKEENNLHITLASAISKELKIDQSVAHNGICLTVVDVKDGTHTVTAIKETLDKTELNAWKVGTLVNLERCMKADGRFDGHIVQGHVDQVATCVSVEDQGGSWKYTFKYTGNGITVEKGSITVNGTSLTVFDSLENQFSVAIIPYTYENTVFKTLRVGDGVNIEFDVIGKYIQKVMQTQSKL